MMATPNVVGFRFHIGDSIIEPMELTCLREILYVA
jgi:hypothetical protein